MVNASSVEEVNLAQSKLLALDLAKQSSRALKIPPQTLASIGSSQQALASSSNAAESAAAAQIPTAATEQGDDHIDLDLDTQWTLANKSAVLGLLPSIAKAAKAATPSVAAAKNQHR